LPATATYSYTCFDEAPDFQSIKAPTAESWDDSLPLQSRLLAAARGKTPGFFAYAENDFSIAPANVLSAEMTRLGRPNRVQIYSPIGKTATEGHDLVHIAVPTWERDVFAFLDAYLRK
jgi:hypothetical protein